jgi:flagellar protein FlbT
VKRGIHISLRAGERLYINGAVLRVDRKVSMEFLNDVTFLLEHHVIHADEAITPLKAHYFIVQTMLIDPTEATAAREMFERSHALLLGAFESAEIRSGLETAHDLVAGNKGFEALKVIRTLFPLEEAILSKQVPGTNPQLKVASCR